MGSYLKKQKIYFVHSVIMLRDCITNLKGSLKKKKKTAKEVSHSMIRFTDKQINVAEVLTESECLF